MPNQPLTQDEFRQGSRVVTYGLGTIAAAVGITLLLQEPPRMSSPGWQTAFAIPGLNSTFWGAYVTVFGVAMLAAIPLQNRKLLGYACIAIALAWSGRVVAATIALEQPHASGTAPQAMLIVAGAYFTHGALYLGWLQWLGAQWSQLLERFRE